jgi:hypothetical protein
MAFSAHKNNEQMMERFEPADSVQEKAEKLADLIKRSQHFIAFTGAGVSTSAGISWLSIPYPFAVDRQ